MLLLIGILSTILGTVALVCNIKGWVYPFPFEKYIFDYGIVAVLLIAGIVCIILYFVTRGKILSTVKPFPITIFRIVLFLIIGAALYFICSKFNPDQYRKVLTMICNFMKQYSYPLFGTLIVINIIRVIDLIKNNEVDAKVNAVYEFFMKRKLSYLTFFNQFFDGLLSRAPYLYDDEQLKKWHFRSILNIIISLIKIAFWTAFVLIIIPGFFMPTAYDIYLDVATKYAIYFVGIFALINCDIFIYTFIKLIGKALSIERFKVVTTFSDGSVTTGTETHSNIIAIIFVCSLVYLINSAYYGFLFTSTITRSIESLRLARYLNKYNATIVDFYQQ